MKTKPNPLTVVILIGVAIGSLFLVSDTYLRGTQRSREVEESNEKLNESMRATDRATDKARREGK